MKPKIDLNEAEENWQTEMGGSIPGERVVVRGKDLFSDLKDYSWSKLLLFMITGRELEENEVEMLEKIWSLAISYPDPRIWNNRIGALAGTTRSTGALGVSAGSAVSEARIYGGQATWEAYRFIVDCTARVGNGEELSSIILNELKQNRAVYGYGRPVVNVDERIYPFQETMKKTGFADGEHVRVAYQIEEFLNQGRWRYKMNIGALTTAVSADIGLSQSEHYLWMVNGYNAGITACYKDARSKQEGTLFPLSCDRIVYQGIPNRTWN